MNVRVGPGSTTSRVLSKETCSFKEFVHKTAKIAATAVTDPRAIIFGRFTVIIGPLKGIFKIHSLPYLMHLSTNPDKNRSIGSLTTANNAHSPSPVSVLFNRFFMFLNSFLPLQNLIRRCVFIIFNRDQHETLKNRSEKLWSFNFGLIYY